MLAAFGPFIPSCTYDKSEPDTQEFPADIASIILTKCASTGCHDDQSKEAAGGLSLSSWNNMFLGDRSGAVVVPYQFRQSEIYLFTNTYADLGVTNTPVMPYNQEPLSRQEVLKLRYWINEGAPNKDGFIKFSDDPYRKKYYVANRGCDLVAVMELSTNLIMRYVQVGNSIFIESPSQILISPDGEYWYVVFSEGDVIQKFRTSDDSFVSSLYLGFGEWNSLCITADSKYAFVVNGEADGQVAIVDLSDLSLLKMYGGGMLFQSPQGVSVTDNSDAVFIGFKSGNFLYKMDISDMLNATIDTVVLEAGQPASTISKYDPKIVFLHPNQSKYFVICPGTNEVRVLDASTDNLIAVIATGTYPQSFSYSSSFDYLFIANTEDTVSFAGKRGSVSVLDCQSNALIKTIYTGAQPYGMAINAVNQQLIVANRNFNSDGPKPHHATECEGRNGYLTYLDINSLTMVDGKKYEISVDPNSVQVR
jgi:DNA-binding beta-propeller fold protein YncE